METQTRHDLNTAIENWRRELATQVNLSADVRRELETHLLDAIAGFRERGLNDEESFWLACKRVGQPPQLGEEFVKTTPAKAWRERVFGWLGGRYVCDISRSEDTMTSNIMSKMGIVGLATTLIGWVGGILAVSAFLIVLWSSDSLLKIYISQYLGWFTIVPLFAFVLGNLGATVLGSIGYAARAATNAPPRVLAYCRSAMILGSVGLLSGAAFLLFTLVRTLL